MHFIVKPPNYNTTFIDYLAASTGQVVISVLHCVLQMLYNYHTLVLLDIRVVT